MLNTLTALFRIDLKEIYDFGIFGADLEGIVQKRKKKLAAVIVMLVFGLRVPCEFKVVCERFS